MRAAITAFIAALALPLPAGADELPTVMSLNVCTDQLAMLLAAPGQLLSVSQLADDPSLSFLHDEAAAYPKNGGRAEEVFAARPDIVVTGTFSLHNTTALLTRLGLRIEQFQSDQTLESIPADIRRMGSIMKREDQAEAIAAHLETELADVREATCEVRPTAIAFEQNGIVPGRGTLADSVIDAAGFTNLGAEAGIVGMAPISLERLITMKPDVVIVSEPIDDAPSLADRLGHHPALEKLGANVGAYVPRGAWGCGAPAALEAVSALRKVRDEQFPCHGEGVR